MSQQCILTGLEKFGKTTRRRDVEVLGVLLEKIVRPKHRARTRLIGRNVNLRLLMLKIGMEFSSPGKLINGKNDQLRVLKIGKWFRVTWKVQAAMLDTLEGLSALQRTFIDGRKYWEKDHVKLNLTRDYTK